MKSTHIPTFETPVASTIAGSNIFWDINGRLTADTNAPFAARMGYHDGTYGDAPYISEVTILKDGFRRYHRIPSSLIRFS